MQHYTTIEQSKKLLELGLKPESADMYYEMLHGDKYPQLVRVNLTNEHRMHLYPKVMMPCWSLGALLELMPRINDNPFELLGSSGRRYICGYTLSGNKEEEDKEYISFSGETAIDSAFDLVVWLIENGYIKKGN